jgi:hypothetical protein
MNYRLAGELKRASNSLLVTFEHYLGVSRVDVLLSKKCLKKRPWENIINQLNADEPIQRIITETEFFWRETHRFSRCSDSPGPKPKS